MKPIIEAHHIWKQYSMGESHSYLILRDTLVNIWKSPFDKKNRKKSEFFWALKNISFQISTGEVLGIIGKNGAGKSTLLKILSRITPPTKGNIIHRGRVASLLEVGTGFHPELTGRENVFLNGAVLGMKQWEIRKKFDQIVDFAEIEKFLDTPVKHYSSGMYMRLAFAVAAHLDPEILLVDEVLAVGDTQFQQKCLGKMKEVSKSGRTVLFVSHNITAINSLCTSCIYLDKGSILSTGKTTSVTDLYIKNNTYNNPKDSEKTFISDAHKSFQVLSIKIVNNCGVLTNSFACDESIGIFMHCIVRRRTPGLYGYLSLIRNEMDVLVSDSWDKKISDISNLSVGEYEIFITVPARTIIHGQYYVYISFGSRQADQFYVDIPGRVCTFVVNDYNTPRGNSRSGYVSTLLDWNITKYE